MKLYLAGPMRGYHLHNSEAFDLAADELRRAGHEVINPVDHDREIGFDFNSQDIPRETFLSMFRWDLARVMEVEAVAFLPGWQRSRGACAERTVAHYLGLPCFDYIPHGGYTDKAFQLLQQPEYHEPQISWVPKL